MSIRIGTRGSKLARWQAEWVAAQLEQHGVSTEIIYLKTLGDIESRPIGALGSDGVFTREIQRALLDQEVDLAVHSLKDLPTAHVDGLELAAIPRRESCGDALVAAYAASLDELPKGAVVGTGSMRRRAQLLAARPDLNVSELRGNVDTRIRKLRDGEFDAIILAEAGLRRLGLEDQISQVLPKSMMLPAVGQGALGLESRQDDMVTRQAVVCLHHLDTCRAVLSERSLLRTLQGGCLAPLGAWARVEQNSLRLDAVVLDIHGEQKIVASADAPLDQHEALGKKVGEDLLSQGAGQLLADARG